MGKKTDTIVPTELNDGDEMICYCSQVSKSQLITAIEKGAKMLNDVREATSACTLDRCEELSPRKKCCSSQIVKVLREESS